MRNLFKRSQLESLMLRPQFEESLKNISMNILMNSLVSRCCVHRSREALRILEGADPRVRGALEQRNELARKDTEEIKFLS